MNFFQESYVAAMATTEKRSPAAKAPAYEWGLRLRKALKDRGIRTAAAAREVAARQAARDNPTMSEAEREELAERMVNSFYKYVSGGVDHPRGSVFSDIAAVAGVSEAWLRGAPETSDNAAFITQPQISNSILAPPPNVRHGSPVELRRVELPIRGRIMGGKEGALSFSVESSDVVGYVEAPPRLAEVPEAYAVYVVGESMEPVFRPGYICCVNPHLPPRPGDDVVIQLSSDNDMTRIAYIKRLVSMNERELKVCQFNPQKTISFPRKLVKEVHRVMWSGPPY
ncbi:S24 family peptidase [Bradyrhizobium denitrificans]|uniref:S24 family peptidase n=1 Tax=Bradyrhizobium denitrificans TaxID=2734912 RepID=UPI00155682FA|nr:LexA family transcriptional regulator [Bradyrhizobium sp. LMG 8443]NPU23987.1 LexA family transcriptional regulator [Bradyrhizobium sp. LMG 8443]